MSSPKRSVAVILALAGGLMVASAASAQALFRAGGLQVDDSTGKQVGTLSNSAGDPLNGVNSVEVVFRTGSSRTVFVDVYRSRLSGNADLFFAEPDCSGPPFLSRAWTGRVPASALAGPRQTVYVQAGAYVPGTMQAVLYSDGGCVETGTYDGQEFAPAVRLAIDLADYFTPPFALRATPGEPIPTGGGAEPLGPTDRIFVFDSTGKKVAAAAAYAVVTGSGITIPMSGVDWVVHKLYFESTDCSGAPFLRTRAEDDLARTSTVGPRKTVYLRSEAPQRRTMYSSSLSQGGACSLLEQTVGPGGNVEPGVTDDFAPAAPIGIDLADYFTPPFSVRAGNGTRSLPEL